MIKIEVQGDPKGGKTTMAALIYSLLGDCGIEAELQGAEAEQVRKMAEEPPTQLITRARRLAKDHRMVIVERMVKRPAKRGRSG